MATPVAPAEAFRLDSAVFGNSVGADQKVQHPTQRFGARDTIYLAVSTTGVANSAVVGVKWTYQDGQTVNDSSQTIAPDGPAVTTFHISKPDGWPTGNYEAVISIDGEQVWSGSFTVR